MNLVLWGKLSKSVYTNVCIKMGESRTIKMP